MLLRRGYQRKTKKKTCPQISLIAADKRFMNICGDQRDQRINSSSDSSPQKAISGKKEESCPQISLMLADSYQA